MRDKGRFRRARTNVGFYFLPETPQPHGFLRSGKSQHGLKPQLFRRLPMLFEIYAIFVNSSDHPVLCELFQHGVERVKVPVGTSNLGQAEL